MGGFYYIVYVDEFGFAPKYNRQSTVNEAIKYISPRDSKIYI